MFAKLVVVIVSLGLCACVLLAARQARIQAAHDLAEARLRILRLDHELWRMRARIAERVTPERVRLLASAITPLRPLIAEPIVVEAPTETRSASRREDSAP